jgi:hypothetical protein
MKAAYSYSLELTVIKKKDVVVALPHPLML